MKILITGAFGFLGSAIAKKMSQNNDNQVFALVKSTSNPYRFSKSELEKIEIITIEDLDFESFFKKNNFQAIIHTATDYGRNNKLDKLVENNIVFPLKLIELSIKFKVNIFINTDSYFNKGNLNYGYLQGYIATKKHLEDYLKMVNSIKIVNIKLEHIYGILDSQNKFVTSVFNEFIQNSNELKSTIGIQKRDFIYIDDIVLLFEEIIKKQDFFQNKYYCIEAGWGNSIAVKDFLQVMKKITNSNTTIEFGSLPLRENEIMDSFADINTIPTFVDWKPKISLEQGIKKMLIHNQELDEK
jgi:CDP-paratose synthetase